MSADQIAAEVGVKPRTFYDWTQRPEFKAKVEIKRKEIAERIMQTGIAVKSNRIAQANDRWRRMHQVIEERATDPINESVAGGTTGLLAHTMKGVGSGIAAQVIDEWEVDTGLLSEIRNHEEQVSKELGQWPQPGNITEVSVSLGVMGLGADLPPESSIIDVRK